ncbi:hypothetical protein CBM2592_A280159 [Cupriavidus taiwanensis]|nr:hypothetical protein CBM2592_A280159 [Cupriavidus taiwanensis]SOY85847.1 hypothetical protein CBM2591_A320161 [Cupriavidus taiwanensis]SPA15693.1 hypothetical protein CBM2631_A330029 [Cupriavidus taiwanensis]SPD44930.1 protein of unknown function [Cupriavidus taiwanensis]
MGTDFRRGRHGGEGGALAAGNRSLADLAGRRWEQKCNPIIRVFDRVAQGCTLLIFGSKIAPAHRLRPVARPCLSARTR